MAFEIVKAAYPGIPDAILNEYAELLPAEAMQGKPFEEILKQYNIALALSPDWVNPYDARKNAAIIRLLNPSNQQFITTESTIFVYGNFLWLPAEITYDKRLYAKFEFKDFQIKPTAKPYSGIGSLVALYENGVALPGVNYEKAYSFLTYINAYKKFSTEIDSERAYLQREAEAQLASYRQDYTDRAQREKSDLQSKKIQMLMAIDNDTKAATRDFQNMLLNAQNLKQNLRGQIG